MGKNKRKRRDEELESRLRSLERRLRKRSRRDHMDEYDTDSDYSSRSQVDIPPDGTGSLSNNLPQKDECPAIILPEQIENLLGKEGDIPEVNFSNLHQSLAKRWTAILEKGLDETVRQSLMKKYTPPQNCHLLVTPKLNEEVAAAITEKGILRDKKISLKQEILSSAIASIGKVLESLMSSEGQDTNIEQLSDSARLLCDLFYKDSSTRRALILPGLNKDMRELMEMTPVSEYLFGDKLLDKMNAAKAVKKTGQELKNTPVQQKQPKVLNYRGPQRPQPVPATRPSGPRYVKKQFNMKKTKPRRSTPPRKYQHRRRQDHR